MSLRETPSLNLQSLLQGLVWGLRMSEAQAR